MLIVRVTTLDKWGDTFTEQLSTHKLDHPIAASIFRMSLTVGRDPARLLSVTKRAGSHNYLDQRWLIGNNYWRTSWAEIVLKLGRVEEGK
jgi:hypothetical protein